jgi:hypothetical protein
MPSWLKKYLVANPVFYSLPSRLVQADEPRGHSRLQADKPRDTPASEIRFEMRFAVCNGAIYQSQLCRGESLVASRGCGPSRCGFTGFWAWGAREFGTGWGRLRDWD